MSNINNLPSTLDMKGLAKILHVSERTIKRWLANKPFNLPPGRQVGTKWVWVTKVVFDWLAPESGPESGKTICNGWDGLIIGTGEK